MERQSDPVQLAAILTEVKSLKDKSFRIIFETQSMDRDSAGILFSLNMTFGWMMFAPNPFEDKDIPTEPAKEFKEDKSPSQRLRAVMYRIWEKYHKNEIDFDSYYLQTMNKLINQYKGKLT